MTQYGRDFGGGKVARIGDRVFRPFKAGSGAVKEIKGSKVKVRWDTGGTRWYLSYKLLRL